MAWVLAEKARKKSHSLQAKPDKSKLNPLTRLQIPN